MYRRSPPVSRLTATLFAIDRGPLLVFISYNLPGSGGLAGRDAADWSDGVHPYCLRTLFPLLFPSNDDPSPTSSFPISSDNMTIDLRPVETSGKYSDTPETTANGETYVGLRANDSRVGRASQSQAERVRSTWWQASSGGSAQVCGAQRRVSQTIGKADGELLLRFRLWRDTGGSRPAIRNRARILRVSLG